MKHQMEVRNDFETSLQAIRKGLVAANKGIEDALSHVNALLQVVADAKRLPAPTTTRTWPAIERK